MSLFPGGQVALSHWLFGFLGISQSFHQISADIPGTGQCCCSALFRQLTEAFQPVKISCSVGCRGHGWSAVSKSKSQRGRSPCPPVGCMHLLGGAVPHLASTCPIWFIPTVQPDPQNKPNTLFGIVETTWLLHLSCLELVSGAAFYPILGSSLA